MSTIRQILAYAINHLDAIEHEGVENDEVNTNVSSCKHEIEAVIAQVDILEGNNNIALEAVERIKGAEYMEELVEEFKTPLDVNHKILY